MVTVRNKSRHIYRGFDEESAESVCVPPGKAMTVSRSKAKQLLRDFVGNWEQVDDDIEPEGPVRKPARNKLGKPPKRKRRS